MHRSNFTAQAETMMKGLTSGIAMKLDNKKFTANREENNQSGVSIVDVVGLHLEVERELKKEIDDLR